MKNIPQAFEFEDKCQECGSSNLVHDHENGETICSDCGVVQGEKENIVLSPEWRGFDKEEKEQKSRVGSPRKLSIHDQGIGGTDIKPWERDAMKQKLPETTRYQMWRLRKWQKRSRAYSVIDRNLAQAMTELDRICDNLSLPQSYNEQAAYIYRKAVAEGIVRGRSIIEMAAACVYAACRLKGNPKTLEAVAKASGLVKKHNIARCYRVLFWELGIQITTSDSPLNHIKKIADIVDISAKSQEKAKEIIQQVQSTRATGGKDRRSIAVAALYIACKKTGEKKTQKDIANAANVTEVTLRNRYHQLAIIVEIIEISKDANIPNRIQERAVNIFQKTQERTPFVFNRKDFKEEAKTIAAALLYLTCLRYKEQRNLKEIADIAKLHPAAVENECQRLIDKLELPQLIKSEEQIVSTLSFLLLNYFIFVNILK